VSKGEIMKIENFALDLNSQKTKNGAIKGVFENELQAINTQDETEFLKVLEYQMIAQLIRMLQTNTMSFNSCNSFNGVSEAIVQERQTFDYEYYKHEALDVQMKGYIQTDTQKVQLDINLSFSSTYMEKAHMSKTQFYDPLVINFDGEIPALDKKTFSFDIDANGSSDQISLLKSGNGFLALDKNENGEIDSGTELFGAHNGNGFYDLKRYDSDHNGWIDENDPILDKLRVWIKDENEDKLVALGELGVGALYLGFTQNSFNLRAEDNEILGKISSNGLYLNEDGTSGLLTQIDFARRTDIKEQSALAEVLKIS
jgi:hypothetical protein